MCGIAGLYTKTPALRQQLGDHLALMLEQLSFRGPDSAGVAFYRDPAPIGSCKVSLHSASADPGWDAVGRELEREFGVAYSTVNVWRILRELGFSNQRPAGRAIQRDEAAIKQWRAKRWPALKKSRSAKGAPSSSSTKAH